MACINRNKMRGKGRKRKENDEWGKQRGRLDKEHTVQKFYQNKRERKTHYHSRYSRDLWGSGKFGDI